MTAPATTAPVTVIGSAPTTAGERARADLAALLRARTSLIWVTTREEARAERGITEAAGLAGYDVRTWDCAAGITDSAGRPWGQGVAATDPSYALASVRDGRERQVWILRDLAKPWLSDPSVLRQTRNLAKALALAPRDQARAIVILTTSTEIPADLQGHAVAYEWPLPDRAEVGQILDAVLAALPEDVRAGATANGTRDAAVDAAVGLTAEEVQGCYARSLITAGRKIDPAVVAKEKKTVIAREKVLEWIDPLAGGLDAVGGLDVLKVWLSARRAAFSARARAYGLPAPKGAMLVGVPGCGKSLTAKAIATAWGMPLLRLDLGALRSKWVGDSEANIRKALRVAETVSPCVLWVDEIEKALAGATQGAADGGVSGDALGVILSWMQDRAGSVFVVATANDVSKLPPELLRKGRFDELFFVDLPNAGERAEIAAAALRANGRTTDGIDLAAVATATGDFTGAEIAALVPEALYAAFGDGERALSTGDLLSAAAATVPLARTASEKIEGLRNWAKGRARPATSPEKLSAVKAAAPALDL